MFHNNWLSMAILCNYVALSYKFHWLAILYCIIGPIVGNLLKLYEAYFWYLLTFNRVEI